MDVAEARKLWCPARTYLNTATYGLPAQPTWDAVQAALEDWHHGRTSYEHWNDKTDSARALFALVNVPAEDVVTGPAISALVGLVAAVPDGSRVVVPTGDFASVMFPFMAQADRGVEVQVVRSTGSPRRSTSAPTSSPRASYSRRRARCSTSTV